MRFAEQLGFLFFLTMGLTIGASPPLTAGCDLTQYRAKPGLTAAREGDALSVSWDGEDTSRLLLRFSIASGIPTIRELAVRKGGPWVTLGRDLTPFFAATCGIRRTGHGLPEEKRWDVYWDAPLQKPDEVRHHTAQFQATGCSVKTDGSRLEIQFPGATMGIFSGSLQFTVYRGTNLIREELIAKTEEPSVAYIYSAGLKGFSTAVLSQVTWQDVGGNRQDCDFSGTVNQDVVPLRAKHRLAIATGRSGSVAVFPPPHQFFFARELEINLGYVWYRKDAASSFSLGVRQHPTEEGYNPEWIQQVYALYNAPPGTWQRMSVYFYASAGGDSAAADASERAVLAFTHNDRYKALPSYKTMVTHFHTAFTEELVRSRSLDTQPPWIPAIKTLGVNIAYIDDFHGDGHPDDPGPLRLKELDTYYQACRRHSDRNLLILPGEEANVYLGGHYNILFPKPVYWTHGRQPGRQFTEQDPKYGIVYRTSNAADVFEMVKRENALVWQTHPRTKGSTFYPDKIRDEDYFRSDHWLGAAFKPLPVDLSQKRLCEVRCFGTLDDMNNWDGPKFMLAEVDTYKKWPQDELYGPFVVNYLKIDSLPTSDDWSAILRVLRAGDFFVTTGELLIREFTVRRQGASLHVVADLEWTFPLEFVEVVWGDGSRTDRKIFSATDTLAFGRKRFTVPIDPMGEKWVRFAAWDSAGNGAFTQPVHLQAP